MRENYIRTKRNFDTALGIRKEIETRDGFYNLLEERRKHILNHPEDKLHEFVIFEKYVLTSSGRVHIVVNTNEENLRKMENTFDGNTDVIGLERFIDFNQKITFKDIEFPPKEEECAECEEKFTWQEIKDGDFVKDRNVFYHNKCIRFNKINVSVSIFVKIFYEVFPNATYCISRNPVESNDNFAYPSVFFCINNDKIKLAFERNDQDDRRMVYISIQRNQDIFDSNSCFKLIRVPQKSGCIRVEVDSLAYYLEYIRQSLDKRYNKKSTANN